MLTHSCCQVCARGRITECIAFSCGLRTDEWMDGWMNTTLEPSKSSCIRTNDTNSITLVQGIHFTDTSMLRTRMKDQLVKGDLSGRHEDKRTHATRSHHSLWRQSREALSLFRQVLLDHLLVLVLHIPQALAHRPKVVHQDGLLAAAHVLPQCDVLHDLLQRLTHRLNAALGLALRPSRHQVALQLLTPPLPLGLEELLQHLTGRRGRHPRAGVEPLVVLYLVEDRLRRP
mmetsp:Transcript_16133/g.38575  ORF Transcript_16133/g.38575 Transcript_16133/m.38575 type:complete len:230 (-) Transcript_16133:751-1440(-)